MARYRTIPEAQVLAFQPSPTLTEEDLHTFLMPQSCERGSPARWARFLDLSQVQDFVLDYASLNHLSLSLPAAPGKGPPQVPPLQVAFFAREFLAFGMARMIASVLERKGVQHLVSRNLPELSAWLGCPLHLLEGEASN